MNKKLLLFCTLILPIIFYLFLYQGDYKYETLPVITENVQVLDFDDFSNKNKLTVVCFLGNNLSKSKASMFNLNQMIYKRFQEKPFFQMVAFVPKESEKIFTKVINELEGFTNLDKWHFTFEKKEVIQQAFSSLKIPCELDQDLHSNFAFIIDTSMRLRGRQDLTTQHCGYDMTNVSELKKQMRDDISILYYAGLNDIEIIQTK